MKRAFLELQKETDSKGQGLVAEDTEKCK